MIRNRGLSQYIKKIVGISQQCMKKSTRVLTCPEVYYEKKSNKTETDELSPSKVLSYADIPGPRGVPIIGNILRFLPYIGEYGNLSLLQQLQALKNDYGNIVKLDKLFTRRDQVFLFSPDLMEMVYRLEGAWPIRISAESLLHYQKSRPNIYKGQYGLATSQEAVWYDIRSKVNPLMLHPGAIKPHAEQINKITEDFIHRMRDLRDLESSELPASFNNELFKLSLEHMCSAAMNHRLGCFEPNLAKDSEPQILIDTVHNLFEVMYKLELEFSLWKVFNTPSRKRLYREADKLNEIVDKYFNRAIEKLRENPKKDIDDYCLLEKLYRIDEHIARITAYDLFLAGVDTTGNAMAALLYYLATNPKKQDKLRKEAISLLPTKNSPVTVESLNNAPYLKACIKESLRLFPILLGSVRNMKTDIIVAGYTIPKGTNVAICHGVMCLDPKNFARPNEYIPERWLKNNDEFSSLKGTHPFSCLPFGFGARSCIGKKFANIEIEMLALKAVRNFKLEWHHGPMLRRSVFLNIVATPLKIKLTDL